jgi:AraC family transcriptional regulator of adaptative response / DNA-3-methyladenine glycosylase II
VGTHHAEPFDEDEGMGGDAVRFACDPLLLDHHACYEALLSHDARVDGRVFVGCTSTGIYCRPVCRVRAPREGNCRFFPSAAAAEAQGFRPCLRCRPELAPGLAPIDAFSRLARRAALLMEEDAFSEGGIESLARSLGVTARHLRRVFEREFGVSPVQYLQTRRLLLAKSLLTDTALPITQVALTAGFGSIRRFNDLFKKRYRMTPASFRKASGGARTDVDGIRLLLGYRPPYGWQAILAFLGQRTIEGVETVRDGSYLRTVRLYDGATEHSGWLAVSDSPARDALAVTVSTSLLPVLPRVLARVRALFDLDCDPARVSRTLSALDAVKPGLFVPGVRVPGCFDPFEMAVRAILGQQVTVKAARTLARRLTEAFGTTVATPFEGLAYAFPSPQVVAELPLPIEDRLGPLGITGARARSIRALAEALLDGSVELSTTTDAEQQMRNLLGLPGFGPWTVQYVAMRALGWPDAFPHTDYGVKKALAPLGPREIQELSQVWRPWRSYATISLWDSLASTHTSAGASSVPADAPPALAPDSAIDTRPAHARQHNRKE